MMEQQQGSQDEIQQIQRYPMLLVVFIILLIAGAIVWSLSTAGLMKGSWSGLFGPIFTAVGVIATVLSVAITLFQRKHLSLTETSAHIPSNLLRHHMSSVRTGKETILGRRRRKGSLIVIGNKKLSGSTVHLCRGFDRDDTSADVASNIVWCMVDGLPTYAAIFPDLKPDRYTVVVHAKELRANVTIAAGQIAEIDWRLYASEKSQRTISLERSE